MKTKLLHDAGGQRTWAIVFDTDDDAYGGLTAFARDERLTAATFTGIGAFASCVLAYFDIDRKEYAHIPIDEQVEVVSLAGDVAEKDGDPQVHAHVVVAKRDSSAHGGHLVRGVVRPTLEVVLVETPSHLRKRVDPATGLALIALDERS